MKNQSEIEVLLLGDRFSGEITENFAEVIETSKQANK